MDTLVLILAVVALVAVGLPMFIVIRMGQRMRSRFADTAPTVQDTLPMEMADRLLTDAEWAALLRHHRHQWLNHLQVISGWLQIQQPARAQEYIQSVLERSDGLAQAIQKASPALLGLALELHMLAEREGVVLRCLQPQVAEVGDITPEQFSLFREAMWLLLQALGGLPGEKAVDLLILPADQGGFGLELMADVPLPDVSATVLAMERRGLTVQTAERTWVLLYKPDLAESNDHLTS